MAASRISRGRVEAGPVGLAAAHRVGDCVVNFEDETLGAKLVVITFLVLAQDRERVEKPLRLQPIQLVELKHSGIDLRLKKNPPFWQPPEGWQIVAEFAGEWRKFVVSVRQLVHPIGQPVAG
jgi:hypothetical protein